METAAVKTWCPTSRDALQRAGPRGGAKHGSCRKQHGQRELPHGPVCVKVYACTHLHVSLNLLAIKSGSTFRGL